MVVCMSVSLRGLSMILSLLGLFLVFFSSFLFSENRKRVSFVGVAKSLLFQTVITVVFFYTPFMTRFFSCVQKGILMLQESALTGAQFVFGYLSGGPMPFEVQGNTFIFALQAVMPIFLIGPVAMVLHYWGILPYLVKQLGRLFQKIVGVRGPLALCAGAKMFFGQTDAPLFVRAYLPQMKRCDVCAAIGMGMATTSVVIMPLYSSILAGSLSSSVMMHLVTSTVLSVPLALMLSRILMPEDKDYTTEESYKLDGHQFSGTMDALSTGIMQAKEIVVGVVITLLVAVALTSLINKILGSFYAGLSLEMLFGWVFAPIAWLMGFSWEQALVAGNVIGQKVAFNEIVAFSSLAKLTGFSIADKTVLFYALAGFANLSSVGIAVGAWRVFAPKRAAELGSLAAKGLFIGCCTAFCNAFLVRLITQIADGFAKV